MCDHLSHVRPCAGLLFKQIHSRPARESIQLNLLSQGMLALAQIEAKDKRKISFASIDPRCSKHVDDNIDERRTLVRSFASFICFVHLLLRSVHKFGCSKS